MQFRRLPPFGGDHRAVAEIVNKIMDGKTNNTGKITLSTGNATSTTLYDERISPDTKIILLPFSAAAELDTAPYGSFQDTTDQTATTTASAYVLSCNTTDYSSGVYISNTSRFNVRNYGIYAIQYSIQWKNTTNDDQDIDIWFRKNGTDIAATDSKFGISPRKSSGNPSHLIATSTFFLELDANDYFEIAWRVSDIGVVMEHYAATPASAGVTPAIPASPSVIVTISYIAPQSYSNIYVSAQTFGEATISHYSNDTADKIYSYVLIG